MLKNKVLALLKISLPQIVERWLNWYGNRMSPETLMRSTPSEFTPAIAALALMSDKVLLGWARNW
ncbi:hypothetical protein H6S82_22825 [Planktothrix sp. FACHB-1355]|uniref:Uncharacterized protein n=1 Tax=Aerosakkonema funiforme FACHB-1375 TaxID=2949571 RepID=A0A926VBC3_9CYAN|nr:MULTISPECIES: hypothetical protein [Oscillatoriales]MBD2180736.1 hypothetical protein [Aerosakkonema funiforme FACHB-1375]MBD3561654.1 hypothetical protein [Planktothrix sp. FACHB-1355]